jgi:type VII secretion-associated serine protease mycosin
MSQLVRTGSAAVVTLLMVLLFAAPAGAVVPGPRPEQWWFRVWAVQDKVWPISQGKGVTVAVLDTGVEARIPDLAGAVLPGTDGAGGDGRTDVDTDVPPGHGTAMAGLIASRGRGTGFVGVAPQAKILPVVAHDSDLLVAGIRFAVDHGAKVISISQAVAGPCPDEMQEAVGYAIQHEVVVVAGAGNSGDIGNPSYNPANCVGVLAVGGVDANLRPYAQTQRQPYVTVAAPATGVGGVLRDGLYHTADGGTSAATALTAAAVALVRSHFPDLSAREVVQRIIASTRDAGPKGKDDQTGYGAVRPYQALTMQVAKDSPNPVFAAYDEWTTARQKKAAEARNQAAAVAKNDRTYHTLLLAGIAVAVVLVLAILFGVILTVMLSRTRKRRAVGATPVPAHPGQGRYTQAPPYGTVAVPSGSQPAPDPEPPFGTTPTASPRQQGS